MRQYDVAEFLEPRMLQVSRTGESDRIAAERFIIAVGTRPARPPSVPFDGENVFSTDDILSLRPAAESDRRRRRVIGSEYACIMATLGVRVTLIEARDRVLPFLDQEIIEAFPYHMRRAGITLRLGEKVAAIEYAAGDVIGFPALASTAMEQGRLAACHAFGVETQSVPELFPYGIYSVPEISMVGKTEQQLTDEGIPYEAGIGQYKEVARGQLLGDDIGMLKLLIHQKDSRILGVHAIGTGATELIHIGQAVMTFGGTVDYFIHNVFTSRRSRKPTRSPR
jgi:NAD(P) transhydrogenase